MTPRSVILASSSLTTSHCDSGSRLGPNLDVSEETILVSWDKTSVVSISSFDSTKVSSSSCNITPAICFCVEVMWLSYLSRTGDICDGSLISASPSNEQRDWSRPLETSSEPSGISSSARTRTGAQDPRTKPSGSVSGWLPRFISRTGTSPLEGLTSIFASATRPSHKGMSPDSFIAAVKWGLPSTTPGMIISLLGGTTTVSVTDMW